MGQRAHSPGRLDLETSHCLGLPAPWTIGQISETILGIQSHKVPHVVANTLAALSSHTLGDGNGRYAAGLGAHDACARPPAPCLLQNILRHLSCLPAPCFACHQGHLILLDRCQDFLPAAPSSCQYPAMGIGCEHVLQACLCCRIRAQQNGNAASCVQKVNQNKPANQ